MRDDRYWPRNITVVAEKVSLINEPLSAPDGTVALPVLVRERPLCFFGAIMPTRLSWCRGGYGGACCSGREPDE
jgi:hypothetical protein